MDEMTFPPRVRVYALAGHLGVSSKEVLAVLARTAEAVTSPVATVSAEVAAAVVRSWNGPGPEGEPAVDADPEPAEETHPAEQTPDLAAPTPPATEGGQPPATPEATKTKPKKPKAQAEPKKTKKGKGRKKADGKKPKPKKSMGKKDRPAHDNKRKGRRHKKSPR